MLSKTDLSEIQKILKQIVRAEVETEAKKTRSGMTLFRMKMEASLSRISDNVKDLSIETASNFNNVRKNVQSLNTNIKALKTKIDSTDKKIDGVDRKLDKAQEDISEILLKIDERQTKLEHRVDELEIN